MINIVYAIHVFTPKTSPVHLIRMQDEAALHRALEANHGLGTTRSAPKAGFPTVENSGTKTG